MTGVSVESLESLSAAYIKLLQEGGYRPRRPAVPIFDVYMYLVSRVDILASTVLEQDIKTRERIFVILTNPLYRKHSKYGPNIVTNLINNRMDQYARIYGDSKLFSMKFFEGILWQYTVFLMKAENTKQLFLWKYGVDPVPLSALQYSKILPVLQQIEMSAMAEFNRRAYDSLKKIFIRAQDQESRRFKCPGCSNTVAPTMHGLCPYCNEILVDEARPQPVHNGIYSPYDHSP